MSYFIVQHPSHGLLQEDSELGQPHWSWKTTRVDKANMRADSLEDARHLIDHYAGDQGHRCFVMESPALPGGLWSVYQGGQE